MTRPKALGDDVARADLGDILARANPTPRPASPPIEWRKFCINGNAPAAQFQNLLNQATSQALLYRTRQLFWAGCKPGSAVGLSSTSFPRNRFRFAFRTSTYVHSLAALVTMRPPVGATYGNTASGCQLIIYSDATETTSVATLNMYYGASPLGASASGIEGWSVTKTIVGYVSGLSPNTDYYAKFADTSGGNISTATVIELQSSSEHLDGYLPQNLTQESEIVALHRQRVAQIQKQLWKYSGPKVLDWTAADGTSSGCASIASATPTNIIDLSSTSVSASSPGFTLDMRYKTRRSQTSVPCIMKVCAHKATSATLDGTVTLKDSAGATIASIANQWDNTFPQWKSTTFNMPANLDKYDIHIHRDVGGTTFRVYAISIWEYEA